MRREFNVDLKVDSILNTYIILKINSMKGLFSTVLLFSLLVVEAVGDRGHLKARAAVIRAPAVTGFGGLLQKKTARLKKVDELVKKDAKREDEEKNQNERLGKVEQTLETLA